MKRKLDANDSEITQALKQAGACVWHIDCREPGRPDKLVGFLGRLCLLEIKAPKTGRLSSAQREAHREMARRGVKVHVVHTVQEAFEAVGIGPSFADQRRQALGEIAAGIRAKSDAFELRAKLVSGTHDYRGSSSWEDAHEPIPTPANPRAI